MKEMKIKKEYLPERCEICHKNDRFDPETKKCTRCNQIINNYRYKLVLKVLLKLLLQNKPHLLLTALISILSFLVVIIINFSFFQTILVWVIFFFLGQFILKMYFEISIKKSKNEDAIEIYNKLKGVLTFARFCLSISITILIYCVYCSLVTPAYNYFIFKNAKENINTVEITLHRSACFGTCPVYTTHIYGDGTVICVLEGYKKESRKETKIDEEQLRELLSYFASVNYFSLNDNYEGDFCPLKWTDSPSVITSIKIGSKAKTISDYLGHTCTPEKLRKLERKIDQITGLNQWIKDENDKLWHRER